MDQQKIGGFIASNRKAQGMTQVELAERLGVTNKAVSKWETGKCLPDAELFQPLCGLLGITVNELLMGEVIPAEQATEKAEATIISLAGDRQKSDRRRRIIRYAAFVVAAINIASNLFNFALPFLGVYQITFLPNGTTWLLVLLHMVFWGVALTLEREDALLQWVTLIICIILPISAGLALYHLPTVNITFTYKQVILSGMPCVLLLAGFLLQIGFRPMFYFSIGLSALGLVASIRNLAAMRKNKAARAR